MVDVKKIFLSNPDFAVKTYIIAPHDYLNPVSTKIVELGVLEIITPEKVEKYSVEVKEIVEYYNLLENARKLYEEFTFQLEKEVVVEIKYTPEPGEFRSLVGKLVDKLNTLVKEVRGLNELIIQLEKEISRLELLKSLINEILVKYPEADVSLLKYSGRDIVVETFIGPYESIVQIQSKALYTIALVSSGDKTIANFVFTRKDYNWVMENLSRNLELLNGIEKYKSSSLRNVLNEVSGELDSSRTRLSEIISRKRSIVSSSLEDLALLKIIIDLEYGRIKALYDAVKSRFVTLIIGWIPGSKKKLIKDLETLYPIHVVFEEVAEPPAEFNNLKVFKPFELLTEMNGAPSKTDWDPTPLITYAFIIFFGLMMADAGYSIGLLLATKYLLPIFTDDPGSEGFRKLQRILYVTGFSGLVVGLLSKSFFGDLLGTYIPLSKPIISTMNAIQLIMISLVLGWIWIFTAHILAFLKNVVKLRDAYGAVSELAISIIMVLGTFVVIHMLSSNKMIEKIDFIENNYVLIRTLLIVTVAVLVFVKIRTTGALGAFLWLFDVAGILGDIFSFMRIAGIMLGTAILAYIFNQIIMSAVIINIGLGVLAAIGLHFFAFALTPIGPFVHSLRLCILEISSKFYEGMNRKLRTLKVHIPLKLTIGSVRRT
ncbi:MAG: hypothetical protein QXT03_05410 [Desulfurococcaceae archaeon]